MERRPIERRSSGLMQELVRAKNTIGMMAHPVGQRTGSAYRPVVVLSVARGEVATYLQPSWTSNRIQELKQRSGDGDCRIGKRRPCRPIRKHDVVRKREMGWQWLAQPLAEETDP
ncbi:hypothetical protein ASE63_25580 [Bosea sp. Root381]|nr:hypothetical protein ASE63_25580 [Bosea sp. Root381]